MQPTILLLREQTDISQGMTSRVWRQPLVLILSFLAGIPQIISNINACEAVVEVRDA